MSIVPTRAVGAEAIRPLREAMLASHIPMVALDAFCQQMLTGIIDAYRQTLSSDRVADEAEDRRRLPPSQRETSELAELAATIGDGLVAAIEAGLDPNRLIELADLDLSRLAVVLAGDDQRVSLERFNALVGDLGRIALDDSGAAASSMSRTGAEVGEEARTASDKAEERRQDAEPSDDITVVAGRYRDLLEDAAEQMTSIACDEELEAEIRIEEYRAAEASFNQLLVEGTLAVVELDLASRLAEAEAGRPSPSDQLVDQASGGTATPGHSSAALDELDRPPDPATLLAAYRAATAAMDNAQPLPRPATAAAVGNVHDPRITSPDRATRIEGLQADLPGQIASLACNLPVDSLARFVEKITPPPQPGDQDLAPRWFRVADVDGYIEALRMLYREAPGTRELTVRVENEIRAYLDTAMLPMHSIEPTTHWHSNAGLYPGTHAEVVAVNDIIAQTDELDLRIDEVRAAAVRSRGLQGGVYGTPIVCCAHCSAILTGLGVSRDTGTTRPGYP